MNEKDFVKFCKKQHLFDTMNSALPKQRAVFVTDGVFPGADSFSEV